MIKSISWNTLDTQRNGRDRETKVKLLCAHSLCRAQSLKPFDQLKMNDTM